MADKKNTTSNKRGAGSKVSPKKNAPARPAKKSSKKAPAKPRKKKANPSGKVRFWQRRALWTWVLSSAFVGLFFLIAATLYFAADLPSIANLETAKRQPGITIKTKDGLTLASYGDVYGDYVEYEAIPKHLVYAVMATEDRRFFDHSGIDVFGIMRAMVTNLRAGRVVQGGSTITQQVAKNIFLTPERTLKRKIQEMLLAFWLESRFTKEQIMAIYLNRVYLGSGNYGIDAASRRYFDKPATEINVIEAAIITGLLKAPTRYSPLSSAERAKKRAHQVLLNMVDAGYMKESDVAVALSHFKEPTLYREGDATGTRYFTDWIADEIPLYLGAVEGDVTVFTTLDAKLQMQAEDAVRQILDEHGEAKKAEQAALISMRPDGAIQAMVGGKSYQESQYNRAVQAERQPGSVFKLFVYLAALEAGASPEMIVEDQPLEVPVDGGRKTWRPNNFDHEFRGEITLREALTHSVNTVSVQLAMAVGLDRVVDMARRLGINGVESNPSIALGAVDATLLDMTAAYAHLANRGRGVQPYGIIKIEAQDGEILYERKGSGLWVVLREQVVRQMNYMLQNVPLEGTGRRAYIGRSMAGKTGTSSEFRDAWFIGFTPERVTGVWVGNDNNSKTKRVTGGNLPAMIWKAFMSEAVKDEPATSLPGSDGNFTQEEQPLPWQQQEEGDGILDMFRSNEPGRGRRRGPELERGFWDQLFNRSAPEPVFEGRQRQDNDTIEYEYPNASQRERKLQR